MQVPNRYFPFSLRQYPTETLLSPKSDNRYYSPPSGQVPEEHFPTGIFPPHPSLPQSRPINYDICKWDRLIARQIEDSSFNDTFIFVPGQLVRYPDKIKIIRSNISSLKYLTIYKLFSRRVGKCTQTNRHLTKKSPIDYRSMRNFFKKI